MFLYKNKSAHDRWALPKGEKDFCKGISRVHQKSFELKIRWEKGLKPGSVEISMGTACFESWCAVEVPQSVSVKWGHGDPHGSKDPRVIDVLETMETPEKSHRDEGFSLLRGINSPCEVFLHQYSQGGQRTGGAGSPGELCHG